MDKPQYGSHGLIKAVGKRYLDKGQDNIFLNVVGDGTLWIALLAALAHINWEEGTERFVRAINLYKLTQCDVLHCKAGTGKLMALLSKLQVQGARKLIAQEAPKIIRAVNQIEKYLFAHNEECLKKQSAIEHSIGDVLWRATTGWATVMEPQCGHNILVHLHFRGKPVKVAANGYYVNVSRLCECIPNLKKALQILL